METSNENLCSDAGIERVKPQDAPGYFILQKLEPWEATCLFVQSIQELTLKCREHINNSLTVHILWCLP